MARVRKHGGAAYALTLDVESWRGRTADGVAGASATETASWLRHHGWKAAPLARGGSIATAWQELGR
jgi:hypothetical protein